MKPTTGRGVCSGTAKALLSAMVVALSCGATALYAQTTATSPLTAACTAGTCSMAQLMVTNVGGSSTYSKVGASAQQPPASGSDLGLYVGAVHTNSASNSNAYAQTVVNEYNSASPYLLTIAGARVLAVDNAASRGDLPHVFDGGGLSNYFLTRHFGTGTVAQSMAAYAKVHAGAGAGPILESAAFFADHPTVTTGQTWYSHAGLWVRGGQQQGGTITSRFGVRVEGLTGQITTTAMASGGSTVIVVASSLGITRGLSVQGTGIPPGTLVTNVNGTSVAISNPTTMAIAPPVNTVNFLTDVCANLKGVWSLCLNDPAYLSSEITAHGLTATAAAPAVASGQIAYGGTIVAAHYCGSLPGSAGCIVVNIGGETHYVPYF